MFGLKKPRAAEYCGVGWRGHQAPGAVQTLALATKTTDGFAG
jgi:hypothetical protein